MIVKCLVQEHNAVPQSDLEPGPPDLESSALTIRPLRLPQKGLEIPGRRRGLKDPKI